MRRRLLGPLGVAAALTAGFSLFASGALAAPTVPTDDDIAAVDAAADDAASQIAALEAELATNRAAYDAATIEAQIAAESYNAALVALEDAEREQTDAAAEVAAAETELDAASAAMAELAMASYRSGGDLAQLGSLLSADGLEDALAEATTYQVLGTSTAAAEQRYADAVVASDVANDRAAEAVTERAEAAGRLEEASAAADQAAADAAAILGSNEARQGALIAELAALRQTSVEMEQQRQEAAEAARIQAENEAAAAALGVEAPADTPAAPEATEAPATPAPTQAPTTQAPTQAPTTTAPTTAPTQAPAPPAPTTPPPTTTKPPVTTPPPAPPSTSANAAALAWARTQLGKPYIWGAAGPSGYDCSGLTMMAYANAGISIPRTSGAQYYAGDLVPVGQMKPGDLIFYSDNGSPSGIYHVAIYAGNGMRLHAPSEGKNVELVPMWWSNVLPYAARP
ncbi:NlpC/P60 family protein [Pseudactinotalea terrae]|uniref:C40 family peptidase n=1 Tax=Pseudactinotalea terrae TaxID=1743262 RepID=UPI0012E0E574|nr:C40 family peptidase [Pseudactinotalea terrae]